MSSKRVKIYVEELLAEDKRIAVSAGTMLGNTTYYCENSFIPKEPWTEISNGEYKRLLLTRDQIKDRDTVGVFKIPNDILNKAKQIGIDKLSNQNQIAPLFLKEKELLVDFNESINDFLHSIAIRKWRKLHGLFVSSPISEQTVAKVSTDSKLMGLHIDNTLSFEVTSLGRSPNRICFNFGEEDRYLLFVDLTINSILNLLEAKGIRITSKNGQRISEAQITELFFRNFPDYPVIKVKVKKGELYIAPTDNIIHDGAHYGKQKPDICLVVLGYFRPFI
ncbi:MAG: hypothetical protein KGZ74_18635 [Chitinophagaceae bacterium]|jgi:hypothetical protein|uniref:hypothetical protein n=1 Tax=Sediminibacterium sp. TaxID=1917865 RepID=UPI001BC32932|nr:hypothetical protein [Chitinophagaceae bacterium]